MPAVRAILEELLHRAVAEGVFPGAVAEVWHRGAPIGAVAAGRTRSDGVDHHAVGLETVYDVASLTKVFTSVVTWRLVSRGVLALEDPLSNHVPPFAPEGVTIADLLRHTGGLAAWRPFYESEARTRQAIVRAAAVTPLEGAPGVEAVYSDLGFILLAEALERAADRDLPGLLRDEVVGPLGLEITRYLPVEAGRLSELEGRAVAATEDCPWRGHVLVGEVHDDNCWCMGGVSGHAGVFSSASEVARLGAELLACRRGEGSLLTEESARALTTPSVGGRTLGLDVPSGPSSSAGALLSREGFGHLGFTGCSLWCDPVRDLVIVLLSNRVHPSRENIQIRELRPRFHDGVVRAFDG